MLHSNALDICAAELFATLQIKGLQLKDNAVDVQDSSSKK